MADNLPPSCAVVTKSGNLNFQERSGPLQSCNGTALPFYTASLQGRFETFLDPNAEINLGSSYTLSVESTFR